MKSSSPVTELRRLGLTNNFCHPIRNPKTNFVFRIQSNNDNCLSFFIQIQIFDRISLFTINSWPIFDYIIENINNTIKNRSIDFNWRSIFKKIGLFDINRPTFTNFDLNSQQINWFHCNNTNLILIIRQWIRYLIAYAYHLHKCLQLFAILIKVFSNTIGYLEFFSTIYVFRQFTFFDIGLWGFAV